MGNFQRISTYRGTFRLVLIEYALESRGVEIPPYLENKFDTHFLYEAAEGSLAAAQTMDIE